MSRSSKFLFIAGFGLLPLWLSVAWLLIEGAKESASSEYWNVAPWMVIVGGVCCTITLAIAFVTLAVLNSAKGSPEEKRKRAFRTFAVLVLLAGAGIAYALYYRTFREADQQEDAGNAEEFVRANPEMREAMGGDFHANVVTIQRNRDGTAAMYEIAVRPLREYNELQFVIVDVSRAGAAPVYRIRCTTTKSSGYRESDANPCKS